MREQTAIQNALRTRLENLRVRYPNYSLRAFAKKAGISAVTLSLLLKGKRRVSQKLALQISERLAFDPQERSEILNPLPKEKKEVDSKLSPTYVQISVDQYRLISDWRAFALLNLIQTVDFENDPDWIAERLGIRRSEVEETLQRLSRLGMISSKGGKLKRTVSKYRTSDDIANLSLRKSHQQTLELAHASLESDPVSQRDFSWVTLTVDARKLDKAKLLIRQFQDDFMELIEAEGSPNEVYRLAIQFFPLTKVRAERTE
jgi:transcriptional regulator with XRE-family HTH domain